MQPLVLLILFLLLLHDSILTGSQPLLPLSGLPWHAALWTPYLFLIVVEALACRRTMRRLKEDHENQSGSTPFKKLDRLRSVLRILVAALLVFDLYALGWLLELRRLWPENWPYPVLWPEMAALMPLLLTLGAGWAAGYPVECELRRRLGLPTTAPTRGAYVRMQFRQQIFILLAPMSLLMGWAQAVDYWIGPHLPDASLQPWLGGAGTIAVFVFSPLLLCRIWKTRPLPEGEQRHRLMEICRRYHVRVRDLRVWDTHHSMVNGAVMGLFGRLRFVLLTDQLLRDLSPVEIDAVMAHELGHVKHRHMIGMAVCALAVLAALSSMLEATLNGAEWVFSAETIETFLNASSAWSLALDLSLLAALGGGWFAAFGWISRRFERQADTFAARHLSGAADRFDPQAVLAVAGALQRVAELNHLDPTRRSWRHGSIAWRCDHLLSLGGRPALPAAIDRQVRWMVAASALTLALVTAYELFLR